MTIAVSRGANPIWFFNNQTGQVVDPTYYAFFLQNVSPYNFQNVYEDPAAATPWPNPIEFQGSGGLPDNIYFDESLVYRIEIRQGNTRTSPLIFNPIQNFQVGAGSGGTVTNPLTVSENMITNPQFVDIFFTSPLTITVAGTYNIAPGWNLILTGTGSITITQKFNQGNNNTVLNNPSYYLDFNMSGPWTSVVLQQTFSNNGAIYDLGAVAVAFCAEAVGSAQTITFSYAPSTGSAVPTNSFTITAGSFQNYVWASNVTGSTNTDQDGSAFVNINFSLPTAGEVYLSNIQITGQSSPLTSSFNPSTDSPVYQEITYQRMVDHEFNVYRNSVVNESKYNLLAGWNFALNPFQFINPALTTAGSQTMYIADQTILHQQTNSSVETGRAPVQNRQGLKVQQLINGPANQFAIIQYIDPSIIRSCWGYNVSSLARMALFTGGTPKVYLKMRLIINQNLPSTISNTEPILSWASGSDPVFSAPWTAIAPNGDPAYQLQNFNSSVAQSPGFPDYSYNFNLPPVDSSEGNATLGIVLYLIYLDTGAPMLSGDYIIFDRVSLSQNEFGVDCVETYEESLKKCEFYYEKSYDSSVQPGTPSSSAGAILGEQKTNFSAAASGTLTLIPRSVGYEFRTPKRTNSPMVTFYASSSGTAANFTGNLLNNALSIASGDIPLSGNWNGLNLNSKAFWFFPGTISGFLSTTGVGSDQQSEAFMTYHVTIDARLGT